MVHSEGVDDAPERSEESALGAVRFPYCTSTVTYPGAEAEMSDGPTVCTYVKTENVRQKVYCTDRFTSYGASP